MQIHATAKVKITATSDIIQTLKLYKACLQFCVNTAWDNKIHNNIKLHPAVYPHIRSLGLHSQLSIACIKQACGMVKKAKSKPIINNISIRYNFPRSASLRDFILSLATINGRQKFKFDVPACYTQYFNGSWTISESLLKIDKKGRCFFMFCFSKQVSVTPKDYVLGIDLGINNVAVTSDRQFFGKDIKHLRITHERFISKIQAKGTKSAKRKLKRVSGRWTRFMAWVNHNISKNIIDSVPVGATIIMEDLTHIRRGKAKRNRWVHKWAFRQLQSFIEYKATCKGCRIVYVNPAYTSKTCHVCHNIDTSRHAGFIECLCCGHSLNSDLNAAINIALRYTRNMCSVTVNRPIVSSDDAKGHISTIEAELRDNTDDIKTDNAPLLAVGRF